MRRFLLLKNTREACREKDEMVDIGLMTSNSFDLTFYLSGHVLLIYFILFVWINVIRFINTILEPFFLKNELI
jgi:hypothetical protein